MLSPSLEELQVQLGLVTYRGGDGPKGREKGTLKPVMETTTRAYHGTCAFKPSTTVTIVEAVDTASFPAITVRVVSSAKSGDGEHWTANALGKAMGLVSGLNDTWINAE